MQELYLCLNLPGFSRFDDAEALALLLNCGRYYADMETMSVTQALDHDGCARTTVRFIFSAEAETDWQEATRRLRAFGKSVAKRLGLSWRGSKVYFAEGRWNVYSYNRAFGLDEWGGA